MNNAVRHFGSRYELSEGVSRYIIIVRHHEDDSLGIISSDVKYDGYQPRFECTNDITEAYRFLIPESNLTQLAALVTLIKLDYQNYQIEVVELWKDFNY